MSPPPADPDALLRPPEPTKRRRGRGRGWETRPAQEQEQPEQAAVETETVSHPQLPATLDTLDVSPLEALLDPGQGLRSQGDRCLSGPAAPGLSSLGQLQLMQLLETPERPAYRLPPDETAPAEPMPAPSADWALLPASQRGRHDALPAQNAAEDADFDELPPASPRPYVLGTADQDTIDASLQALAEHEPALPDIGTSSHVRVTLELGQGEATFLNARSALWSWRPHRQSGVKVHTHGPPVVGRDVLLEQRAGLVTVLQGCRVLTLQESDHVWGFTLGSLDGQVYQLWERLLIERDADDRVMLRISSHHEVALRGFGLVSGLLHGVRRSAVQGYARGMSALAEL